MYSAWIEFVRELYSSKASVPLHAPVFVGAEKESIQDCLDSTYVSSVGEYVSKVEEKLASMLGVKHAVMVVNGTAALHMCLVAAGIAPEDEVITQPLTFVATCNAIKYCGAYPVFVDVDADTLGLSPSKLLHFLKTSTYSKNGTIYNRYTNRRIHAVLPMHTFGHPCQIDKLQQICEQYDLKLIEDCAEALGSTYKKHSLGTFGKLAALSFNGNKIITAGGGGAILTSDDSLAQLVRHLTTTAKQPHAWHFTHDRVGYNYRMPNLNAALLWAQLEVFPQILESKREVAKQYEVFFKNIDWATLITEPKDAQSNYWLNTIQLHNKQARDDFLEKTNANSVMTRPAWTLMPDLPMFSDDYCADISQSRIFAETLVNIPSSARLT